MSRTPQTTTTCRDRRKAPRASHCIERWYYRLALETFAADPSLLVGNHDTGKTAALRRLGAILDAQDAMSTEQPSESGLAHTAEFHPATLEPSS